MFCYEIHINGKKICTVGSTSPGIISAILTLENHGHKPQGTNPQDRVDFTVGGTRNNTHGEAEYINWIDCLLKAGDEVKIKVIEAEAYDEPVRASKSGDPEDEMRKKQEIYELIKKKYDSE